MNSSIPYHQMDDSLFAHFMDHSEPASVWSAKKLAALQVRLRRQLGPEFLSFRPGANGGRVAYLEAWRVINLANDVFGFNGWCSSIQNVTTDYIDEKDGRYSIGMCATVRITLRDGTFHEDVGYGHMENSRSKAAAFEKCRKEACTDGLKRALRSFGNLLGNCLYDKSYIKQASRKKVKYESGIDVAELRRAAPLPGPVSAVAQRSDVSGVDKVNMPINMPKVASVAEPGIVAVSVAVKREPAGSAPVSVAPLPSDGLKKAGIPPPEAEAEAEVEAEAEDQDSMDFGSDIFDDEECEIVF